jgi:hypothetical protein
LIDIRALRRAVRDRRKFWGHAWNGNGIPSLEGCPI